MHRRDEEDGEYEVKRKGIKFMRLPGLSVLILVLGCSNSERSISGPLTSSPPPGWKVEYKGDGGIDFYSATPKEAGKGVLMFSKWPPPSKPEEIPTLVRNLADGLVKTAKGSNLGLSTEKYEIEHFSGNHCTGSYAVFRVKADRSETLQTVFFMNVDGQIWNGQFTGTAEDWAQALQMLKSIKANR